MIKSLSNTIRSQCLNLHQNVRGGASIEFCLVLPVFWFLLFLLAQTMFVFLGKLHVEHAAFAAVRSAIVQIPRNDIGDGFNVISPDDEKAELIRNAAVLALIGTASQSDEAIGQIGGSSSGGLDGSGFSENLAELYSSYDKNVPNWVETIPTRLDYANAATEIKIYSTNFAGRSDGILREIEGRYTFGPRDPVTIEVIHKKYLSMPYVRWIFADEENSRQRTMISRCTLHLEGVITTPPPTPPLPRETP